MTIYKDLKIGSSVNGTSQRYTYNVTSSVSSVSGADANGNTLAYDSGFADVYLNGVRLSGADITITSGNSVSFASNLSNGDVVDIVAYGAFTVASVNADNLSSGTVPDARITGTYTGITGLDLTDNSKIRLGTGNDLQIYHDGSNSYIDEQGTGSLFIRGANTVDIIKPDGTEYLARFVSDSYNKLYYDGSERFETTSTGATVTTTLSGANDLTLQTSDANEKIILDMSGTQRFRVNGAERMRLTTTGLGIGTSSPDTILSLEQNNSPILQYKDTSGGTDAKVWRTMGLDSDYRLQTRSDDLATGELAYSVTRTGKAIQTHQFFTTDSERLRITSTGSVGIGTSSPVGVVGTDNVLEISGSSNPGLVINDTGQAEKYAFHALATKLNMYYGTTAFLTYDASNSNLGINNASPSAVLDVRDETNGANFIVGGSGTTNITKIGGGAGDNLQLFTNSSTAVMMLSTSGNVGIGTSSPNRDLVIGDGADAAGVDLDKASGVIGQVRIGKTYSGQTTGMAFKSAHSGSSVSVGSITYNNSSTGYNTSSDYRLKENINYDFDATARLKQLKPARFNFIEDADTTVDGFLAHEVSSVVPEAITGTKDAVEVWEEGEELPEGVSVGDNKLDDDGNTIPDYQGIDQSKLVPLLVKTIQELEARITTLENN